MQRSITVGALLRCALEKSAPDWCRRQFSFPIYFCLSEAISGQGGEDVFPVVPDVFALPRLPESLPRGLWLGILGRWWGYGNIWGFGMGSLRWDAEGVGR